MAMLPRLEPRTFYDLVVEVAIVRPGPISGGMVHPYLRRRAGEEEVEYPHPSLKPVLEKTLGVPLFQEQVMRLAVVAADYTPGEADQLRRDMAAWRRTGRIEHHRERLVSRMTAKGVEREFAERVFQQIRGFGEYGFPESHAASFALLAYATAYLKRHYPAEFACALLNSLPMGFYSAATIVDDAKRHGIVVLPADVARSGWDCALEGPSRAVRVGLKFVKGLSSSEFDALEAARRIRAFESVDDFTRRVHIDRGASARLAEAGAFESLGGRSRRGDLWSALAPPLDTRGEFALPDAEDAPEFAALDAFDAIGWDYRATRLSTRGHPLEPLRDLLRGLSLPDAREVARTPHGRRVRYAGLVICRQRPGTASGVLFMTLEDETGFVNLVVWPGVFETQSTLVRTAAFLGVEGKVQSEKGVVHVVVEKFFQPSLDHAPASPRSHDFR
jgi:error-prone DNA polymerase